MITIIRVQPSIERPLTIGKFKESKFSLDKSTEK